MVSMDDQTRKLRQVNRPSWPLPGFDVPDAAMIVASGCRFNRFWSIVVNGLRANPILLLVLLVLLALPLVASAAKFTLRSEEHTSELQSLMRTSYAVFCLKKKKKTTMY